MFNSLIIKGIRGVKGERGDTGQPGTTISENDTNILCHCVYASQLLWGHLGREACLVQWEYEALWGCLAVRKVDVDSKVK